MAYLLLEHDLELVGVLGPEDIHNLELHLWPRCRLEWHCVHYEVDKRTIPRTARFQFTKQVPAYMEDAIPKGYFQFERRIRNSDCVDVFQARWYTSARLAVCHVGGANSSNDCN